MRTVNDPLIDITVVCVGSQWRILVGGEIDLRSGCQLSRVGDVLAEAHVESADLDLADVTFIDTAGWRAVAGAQRAVISAGGTSRLTATSPAVDHLLDRLTAGRATQVA